VKLTRRVSFSAGHRYWFSKLTAEENRALFGAWASPYSHGHNYVLAVTIQGEVEKRTGMVVNIKTLDDIVRERIVSKFDGKSLNDEVAYFKDHAPTVEQIMVYARDLLCAPGVMPKGTSLIALRLEETPLLYGEIVDRNGQWKTSITRVYEFAASHRLHSDALSLQENVDLFGKCNNPAGHGHNFVLEVTVEGEPDVKTGMIADIQAIDDRVNELVVDRLDHKHLNEDIPEFTGQVVTSEVLVAQIFKMLDGKLPAKLSRVRLFETARSYFEVTAVA
jgi:6-pyruvoyltetrahydropterin/6-carboxytetrahydropterin synthase